MREIPIVYFEKFIGLTKNEEKHTIQVNYELLSYDDIKKDDFLENLKNGTIHCVVIDEFDNVITSRADVIFKDSQGS